MPPVSLSPRKLLTLSWAQSYLLPHPLFTKRKWRGMSYRRWFPWHCSQPPFGLPYKEPPYIHQGWGWNRLLLHNLECGPPCVSCHRFMRPVGSLEKEWYSSLKMSTLPVDVRFLFLPYPISTLVIFYFLEHQMSVLDKSWRISVWCQKKYWDTGVFSLGTRWVGKETTGFRSRFQPDDHDWERERFV